MMLAAASIIHFQAIERKGSDDNCHLHIGKTKKTSHAVHAATPDCRAWQRLAAATDDKDITYKHS